MASMRDAMKRLQVIYDSCSPEAAEQGASKSVDDFTRIRRKLHSDCKIVRQLLKEREMLTSRMGTTSETAEASYRIRVAIKSLKEELGKMDDIIAKEDRKKRHKNPEEHAKRKEITDLCHKHVEEVEALEKKKFTDRVGNDRLELLTTTGAGGARYRAGASKGGDGDPFMNSDLAPIDPDVDEDLKKMKERNHDIDNDLDVIGKGVTKLKDIANEMNQELEKHNEMLDAVDTKVNNALDHVDSVNIKMKVALEKMMRGDKFMINCILLCVLLALIAFVATQFTGGF
ncbi:hypothetical protein SeMB42_g01576 [Synchytrium endobioticum]|uniref:t-SNARE coiled-coil homology domain-containing protein n=1 Tax=Synchytrium endobioticum TaxID=286115 RepID=A0A507DLE1_9FUNG|nr:hypothetical protein SeLEV6574_g01461 [Synchytrium endobioticum]TPX52241.1 hypothetical protein SeMB42_g01576 [Synchytrium endobioticum]